MANENANQERVNNVIKDLPAEIKSKLKNVAYRMGLKNTDEFFQKLVPEFMKEYDSPRLQALEPTVRAKVACNIVDGNHTLSSRRNTETVEMILIHKEDRPTTPNAKGEITERGWCLVPSKRKAFALVVKGKGIETFAMMKEGDKMTVEGVGIGNDDPVIFMTGEGPFKITGISQASITIDMLKSCVQEFMLTQLAEKCGVNSILAMSTVIVHSVSTPTQRGAYHNVYDQAMSNALDSTFKAISLWVPSDLGPHGAGSELVVVYSAYKSKDEKVPKGNAIIIVPKIKVPYVPEVADNKAPEGALPAATDQDVEALFNLP